MPWQRVWEEAFQNPEMGHQGRILKEAIDKIRAIGAEVVENADFPCAETIIPPNGWDW